MTLSILSKKAGSAVVAESEHVRQTYSWRQHLGGLIPILIIYLFLAFYGIDRQSLWLDEVLSVEGASSTEPIWKQPNGLLYFGLLRLWIHVGTSELILRSLSALLGAVAVCLVYLMSVTLFTRWVAVIGTALFATSPFLIWYSQEVRYITLMLVTTLLTMYVFQRLISRSHLGWWLAYSGTVILALSSFVSTCLLPVAQGLYLLWSPSYRPLLRKWLVCQMVIFALFMGWAINTPYRKIFFETTDRGQESFSLNPKRLPTGTHKEFTPAMIPYTFYALSVGFSLGPSLRDLHVDRSLATLMPHVPTLLIPSVLFGVLFFWGLIAIWRQPNAGIFLTLWIGIPIMGALSISALTSMAYNVRYVAMVLPVYILILAAGIGRFRRPVVQIILLAVVMLVNGFSLVHYYFDPQYAREDTRAAVQYLESVGQPGDIVLVVGAIEPMRYYYRGNLPIVELGSPHKIDRVVAERWWERNKAYNRLWLVEIRSWQADPTGKVKAALNNTYNLAEHKQLPGVVIYAYQLSNTK